MQRGATARARNDSTMHLPIGASVHGSSGPTHDTHDRFTTSFPGPECRRQVQSPPQNGLSARRRQQTADLEGHGMLSRAVRDDGPMTLELPQMSPAVSSDLRPVSAEVAADADLLDESDEMLIEEISIDGMCGVY